MKFLRNLLAAILGCIMAFGILFVMFLVFASLLGSSEDSVTVRNNSVLVFQLEEPVKDYVGETEDPFAGLFTKAIGLDNIIEAIQVAKTDKKIKGISIEKNFLMAGLAQTQSIRKALEDFKESGKFVYAFSDFYTQKDYYLASVSDSVFLNPVGILDFKGLASEVLFFKDLQEKTGLQMEVIRHGKYKSAVEPYLSNEMSDANRTQIKELLTSLWGSIIDDISDGRNISTNDLNVIADTLGGRSPEYAKKSGLIDDLSFFDEYKRKLRYAVNSDEEEKVAVVGLGDYIRYSKGKMRGAGKDKIAVIYAQGEIFYGEGSQETIGQGMINEAVLKASEDDNIKAIVLRVDSPGGSALASDIIWRELELAKANKPVVVSMGNVAASGGYYIAAGADKIYAEPTTVTGSIGVFGVIPNGNKLAGDIGINAEQVGTNANSVDYSFFEPMSEQFRVVVQEGVEQTYNTFLDRVSKGRGITAKEVDSIAQGRVWSGAEAKKIGLVDELGTLGDAIKGAAELAEISSYRIRKYPKFKSGFERFVEDMSSAKTNFIQSVIKQEIGNEAYNVLEEVRKISSEKQSIQARMPYHLNIK